MTSCNTRNIYRPLNALQAAFKRPVRSNHTSQYFKILLAEQIDATFQVFQPIQETVDHFLALKRRAVLRHYPFHIQLAHHVHPIATGFVATHVALVETQHAIVEQMLVKIVNRFACGFRIHQRSTHVT